ncbi:hypothetical protein DFH07DRAFT_967025 [Mycena maculata]|uniref:UBC core domain-containing protein n=1 Tax=Mycena maculata TaxID=230809 RepID=A0AAD7MY23_9AGAR|nr:hypothetical protein DFH07DRAFT_967025 [Mycena maculata]
MIFTAAVKQHQADHHSFRHPEPHDVSVDATATNADLAREIAVTLDQPSVTLEILDGFALRDQDGVDMIPEDEIVTARSSTVVTSVSASMPKHEPVLYSDHLIGGPESTISPHNPGRIQIRFVTAELARVHARGTPKTQTEATNGILAFDGEFVSGNTTLRAVQREAAHVLGWASPDSMDEDDTICDLDHEDGTACSCPIAQDIEQFGLASNLHCRLATDGSSCGKQQCAYSHVNLISPDSSSNACSICTEPLVSPCPRCSASAQSLGSDPKSVVHCPLVQNAGCGHLHHAHRIGARRTRTPLGCPTGCPTARFPREAAVFDRDDAHLTLAWDGEKVDRIPIFSASPSAGPSTRGSIITLTTEAVIALVERFFEQQGFTHPGLSLLIHFRDPVAEYVLLEPVSRRVPFVKPPAPGHAPLPPLQCLGNGPRAQNHAPTRPYSLDLHTAHAPILACGCTLLRDVFLAPGNATEDASVLLYAVKRRTQISKGDSSKNTAVPSKQSMYLADAAWHPSVVQTPRGIAALLSALYLLAHAVAQKGPAGEQKVLAVAHAILRFPPAVRTLAGLFLNKVPGAEEKAALAEALYHALNEFSARGPGVITSQEKRRFETVRILLAYMAGAANASSGVAPHPQRVVDEISLACAISHKRLCDPVRLGGVVVERAVAALRQPGGLLFRPSAAASDTMEELSNHEMLRQLLAHSRGLRADSTLLLRVVEIGAPPAAWMATLDAVGRDFTSLIMAANRTELVARGPLELKSADVVPPQIVLDQEGLLAVFTGRGCGTVRDVNFFRPTHGGDTEVDVNDVGHALNKVVPARVFEGTWQVDSYGDVAAEARAPDEAIVLCLDLSESMSQRSGVSKSGRHRDEAAFDVEAESEKVVEKITRDLTRGQIMQHAGAHLQSQHPSCRYPWRKTLDPDPTDSSSDDEDDAAGALLQDLAIVASREALKLSFLQEDDEELVEDEDEDEDEDMYGDIVAARSPAASDALLKLSCFAAAVANDDMYDELVQVLEDMLRDSNLDEVGEEPYNVLRALFDFKTGDLLTDPVRPKNAPRKTFVNSTSKLWFESQLNWPAGPSVAQYESVTKLKKAVASWIAGTEILLKIKGSAKNDAILVTLRHLGKTHSWTLLPQTPIRTLYSLAHRATEAAYSSFALRLCYSYVPVRPTDGLLSQTHLAHGGDVEISQPILHKRQSYDITMDGNSAPKVLLPQDSSVLALLSYIRSAGNGISDMMLWHGLQESGDGVRRGQIAEIDVPLSRYALGSDTITFDEAAWRWLSTGAQKTREDSRHLSRLDLLKELFTVFLNRAGSFDAAVSLVLGLVTFSNDPTVDQDLTPVFEKFREKLESVFAEGDTAVYGALDSARQLLINYRPEQSNLRRRIIIVSDGEDTSSDISAWEVCGALQKSRIIVDSVQVGQKSSYRFSPRTSLADALSIFDLETMLYSGERPFRPAKPVVYTEMQLQPYENFRSYPIDIVTADQFPPRAEHRKLKQRVKFATVSVTHPGGGDDRMKRIMREIKALVSDPHPAIDVYVNHQDCTFLKIIVEAPKDVENCPYKGGTFLLTCDLPVNYPRDPPEIRFVTFILHPNVSKQGKVCIAELGRLWSSDITLKEIFSLIYGTLLTPDLENPLEIQASLKYCKYDVVFIAVLLISSTDDDDGTYALAVADAIAKHASKTRRQWQEELDD